MTDTNTPSKALKSVQPTKLKTLAAGQPASFPMVVQLKRLDGELVELTLTMKAHGKRAWSKIKDAFYDDLRKDAVARIEAADGAATDAAAPGQDDTNGLEPRVSRSIANDARLVAQIAKGWDLEDAFAVEALEDLEDRFGGALTDIVNQYDRAIYQGQLGN